MTVFPFIGIKNFVFCSSFSRRLNIYHTSLRYFVFVLHVQRRYHAYLRYTLLQSYRGIRNIWVTWNSNAVKLVLSNRLNTGYSSRLKKCSSGVPLESASTYFVATMLTMSNLSFLGFDKIVEYLKLISRQESS